ncbi:MAG: hypothetical protein CENE_00571 [Candidatus Celerinatantimonas neptuna]|nr:MAG: hypothetical protein CENE_00571 [Candidatus Celerinatantimonas neptuna]
MDLHASSSPAPNDDTKKYYHQTLSERDKLLAVIEGTRCAYWEYDLIRQQLSYTRAYWGRQAHFVSYDSRHDIQALQQNIHPSDQTHFYAELKRHLLGINPVFATTFRFMGEEQRTWKWFKCRGRIVTYTDEQQPAVMAGIYQDVTREHRKHEQLNQMALRDPLTGLPNRYALTEDFHNHIHGHTPKFNMALFYLDLDGFKEVNDTINHHAGDQLLCELANKLEKLTRREEKVYRIGGDEFVLFVPHFEHVKELKTLAERITREFNNHSVIIYSKSIPIGISVGVATYRPSDTLDSLLARADTRMYEVKHNGKNGYRLGSSID